MSNLIDNSYTQLNNLIQINADDIQTESINTKALYINNILFDPSGNYISDYVTLSTAQNISNKTFTGTTIFSSIQLNSDLIVNSGGTTITNNQMALIPSISTISTDVNNLKVKTTNQSFSGTTTTFTGSLTFPDNSISRAAVNGGAVDILTTQTISAQKTMSALFTCTNNIRLDGSLLVGTAGNVVLINSTLQKIAYLANVTSDINATFNNYVLITALNTALNPINTDISTLNTKTQYISSTSLNTTISNTLNLTDINFTGNINNTFTKAQFDNGINFSKDLTSSAQQQINSINTNLGNYALESEVQSILDNKIGTMVYYQPTDFNIVNNLLTNGELQYSPDGSTKINLIPIITSNQNKLQSITWDNVYNFFDINQNCHIYGVLKLGNYADVEYSLGAVITAQGITAGFTAGNTTAIAFLVNTTIPGINLAITGLGVDITDLETEVGALQLKTSQISYNSATDRTTINQTLYSPNLEIGNLTSGFNQTENSQITLSGLLRCNNRVEINNTLELVNNNNIIVEGIINQDNATPPNNGVNQFLAPTNISGNLTCSGTNTNINSTNFNITGNTIIKNTSTTSSGTIPPYLSVLSTINNANAKKLQGILIGRESNSQESNCNIGYNWVTNANLNNYGYLGLNVNTINLIESFRWFDGGCSIPVGNLTISVGNLTVTTGNISLPTGNLSLTNGDITLTNGEINLTSGDLNIVSGDATLTSGDLSLGTGDISVNNGDLKIFNGELKTNTISKYSGTTLDINSNGVGSILNLNAPTINIGYNQGLAAVNVINIGSTTSFSTINLNGLVVSAFGFNIGQVTQW